MTVAVVGNDVVDTRRGRLNDGGRANLVCCPHEPVKVANLR